MSWFTRNAVKVILFAAVMVMTSYSLDVTSKEYVVETAVFVDKIGVERWEANTGKVAKADLEAELRAVLFEVNEIYRSLRTDYGLKIRFQLKEMELLTQDITSQSIDGGNEANAAADYFITWLNIYQQKVYDVAILFTGANLYLGSAGIQAKGFAKVSGLCTKRSVGIVELTGTYDDVLTTSHEMAHIFGAQHDMSPDCPSNAGNIMMNGKDFLTAKRYQFSKCTYQSFKRMLEYLSDRNCLLKGINNIPLKSPRYGMLVTADTICKRKYGSTSFVSRQAHSPSYGDNLCLKLACRKLVNWKTGKYVTEYEPSPDGLDCGMNKQCSKGKCVQTSSSSPSVSDTCPLGDQPIIEGTYPKSCGQIDSKECSKWKDICCQTCNKDNAEFGKTADDACRNLEGSKSTMLRASYTATTYSQKICSQLVCLKDPSLVNNTFQHNKYTAPTGMACGKNKRCSQGNCVPAADGNPDIYDSCPFGDQPWLAEGYKSTCDAIVWRNGCKRWGKVCCGFCRTD